MRLLLWNEVRTVYVKTCFMKVLFKDMDITVYLIKHTLWRHMGSGGLAPHILHHGSEWRWLLSCIPRTFSFRKLALGTHWISWGMGVGRIKLFWMLWNAVKIHQATSPEFCYLSVV
jgi:hypothetical protein